eukprot:6268829-Amphidinium_carterae.1
MVSTADFKVQQQRQDFESRLKQLRGDGWKDDVIEARLRDATARIDALETDLQRMEVSSKAASPPPLSNSPSYGCRPIRQAVSPAATTTMAAPSVLAAPPTPAVANTPSL